MCGNSSCRTARTDFDLLLQKKMILFLRGAVDFFAKPVCYEDSDDQASIL